MKNLILTFILVLGSFMSLGQSYIGTLKINGGQENGGQTIVRSFDQDVICTHTISFTSSDINSIQLYIYITGSQSVEASDTTNPDWNSNFKIENNVLEVYLNNNYGIATFNNTNLSVSTIEVSDLKLFPNPVNDVLNVSFNSNDNVPVTVMNLNGQVVFETTSSMSTQIDVSNFQKGMYFLCIGNTRKKFVKE